MIVAGEKSLNGPRGWRNSRAKEAAGRAGFEGRYRGMMLRRASANLGPG